MDELMACVLNLITNSGAARSTAFEAFGAVQEGDFDRAQKLLAVARDEILAAHKIQTGLIQKECSGEKPEISLMMIHAQDHLMTSILARDIIEKMIVMQNEINELKKK